MNKVSSLLLLSFVLAGLLAVSVTCSESDGKDPRPYPEDEWGPKRTNEEILALMRELAAGSSFSSSSSASSHGERATATNVLFQARTEGMDQDMPDLQHFRVEQSMPSGRFVSGHIWILNNPINHFSILPPLGGCGTLTKPSDTARQEECIVATNAGFFNTHTYACNGNLVSEGSVIQNTGLQNANFGIRKDGQFQVGYLTTSDVVDPQTLESPFEDLVAGVVWIVKDGKSYVATSVTLEDMSSQETGSGFATIQSARNSLGHDDQGRLILFTADGKSYQRGVDLFDMANLLIGFPNFKIVNAINLDGGGSAVVVENATVVSYPSDECPSPNQQYHCERAVTSITCIHRNPRIRPTPTSTPSPSSSSTSTRTPTASQTPSPSSSATETPQPSATMTPFKISPSSRASISPFHSFSSTPTVIPTGASVSESSEESTNDDNDDDDDSSFFWMAAVGALILALLISIVFNLLLGAYVIHNKRAQHAPVPVSISFDDDMMGL